MRVARALGVSWDWESSHLLTLSTGSAVEMAAAFGTHLRFYPVNPVKTGRELPGAKEKFPRPWVTEAWNQWPGVCRKGRSDDTCGPRGTRPDAATGRSDSVSGAHSMIGSQRSRLQVRKDGGGEIVAQDRRRPGGVGKQRKTCLALAPRCWGWKPAGTCMLAAGRPRQWIANARWSSLSIGGTASMLNPEKTRLFCVVAPTGLPGTLWGRRARHWAVLSASQESMMRHQARSLPSRIHRCC